MISSGPDHRFAAANQFSSTHLLDDDDVTADLTLVDLANLGYIYHFSPLLSLFSQLFTKIGDKLNKTNFLYHLSGGFTASSGVFTSDLI